jgi:glycosyltransferase involved in cell wall biosynthesis
MSSRYSGKKTILLLIPTLAPHDAMGRDLLMGGKILEDAGFTVKIYAEHLGKGLRPPGLITLDAAKQMVTDENCMVFYHMGVYWHLLMDFARRAKGPIVIKYHNMTPPRYFANYDHGSFVATNHGLKQVHELFRSRKVDGLIGASAFNLDDIIKVTGKQSITDLAKVCDVQAPFTDIHQTTLQKANPRVEAILSKSKFNVLFVGRLVPNKGHHHLMATMKSYEQLYSKDFQLILCGSLSPAFQKYMTELMELATRGAIADKVQFIQDASDEDLSALYRGSQAFLCMSEHEGFCVPVIEAQSAGLPVVTWNQAAVGGTTGKGGIVLNNLDYDVFATALDQLRSDAGLRAQVVAAGQDNARNFGQGVLGQKLIDFMGRF